ncbi:hypothetical protein LTR69_006191 [Exophiala sideris]|uniref:Aldehyde dehydrogenase domain-containing protein n=1 Tax=Exophiala sideris TaxID=1016849 RepID=A0ABR0JAS3_9EURO|nr:hypothetical protein LTR69_006191 [Exophiala sideris]
MSTSITNGVLSAVADRRTKDLRYRQRQLISLHRWLSENHAELESATREDNGLSAAETHFIVASGLDALRQNYDSLDLKRELAIEFRIKNGQDNIERRLSEDIVYVIPDNFTLFYSVMTALCAAVAAGSCCVIELSNDLRRTSGLMQKMVFQSLDNLSFVTTMTRPENDFLRKCVVLDQQNCVSPTQAPWLIRSQVTMAAVVIVDRTADVASAAKVVAMSTVLFGGNGPYAPSCILVNEFVEEDFSRLFYQYASAIRHQAVTVGAHKKVGASNNTRLTRVTDR